MPKRIQRKRTKGWKMPEGCIYCGRPSKWGNWAVGVDPDLSLELFRNGCDGIWSPRLVTELPERHSLRLYDAFARWLKRTGWSVPVEGIRCELRGHDLACWCGLDRACHVDILLEIANR